MGLRGLVVKMDEEGSEAENDLEDELERLGMGMLIRDMTTDELRVV